MRREVRRMSDSGGLTGPAGGQPQSSSPMVPGGGGSPPSAEPGTEVTVGALATDPNLIVVLRRVAGESGLERPIRHPRVQKSGLALAGHFYGVVPARVQVLGETELSYLDSLSSEGRSIAARGLFSLGLSCVIVTSNRDPPRALVQAAEATHTPLFVSDARSSRTINAVHAVLDDRLAPQAQLHGVLVDVYGVGLLLRGKSGIGKSECALELVLRGHRLVADDVVRCDWRPPGIVYGTPNSLLRHHIEIRGLGVLNIRELFGVTSVCERARIDVVMHLVDWDEDAEYDRLGLETKYHTILGTQVRELTVPVRPGRDMGSILEIAARNELLRRGGGHSARDFLGRLEHQLIRPAIEEERGPDSGPPPPTASSPAHVPVGAYPPGRPTWTRLSDRTQSNESSAWIPAVRPKPEDE
jgi:HPr kinase/phosphorylase